MWEARVIVGNIVMNINPRPFKGFYRKEREAILVAISQALSEVLFGVSRYLVHPKTGASADNPDWELLTYFVPDEDDPEIFSEIQPEPTISQKLAGDELPSG